MAIQPIPNGLMSLDSVLMFGQSSQLLAVSTINAAGESCAFIGKIYIEGAASSKTISSAGGKITFRTITCTFANAATNFRVGIQDLTAGGVEDGTFDVYADFTGGGGGIASSTWYEKAMTTGTKTLNHLGIYAICFEMTTRGGTDSVEIESYTLTSPTQSTSANFPYRTVDTGAGPAKSSYAYGASIVFDDGTIGWIEGSWYAPGIQQPTTVSYNSGSTPDEYAAVFQVPYKCSIRGGYLSIGSIAATDNFEILLYSDPQGTPAVQRTATINPNYTGSVSNNAPYLFSFSTYTLSPATWYAIALRPTTANSISLAYINITSAFGAKYKKSSVYGSNVKLSSRTNQTGVFTEVFDYYMPVFGLFIDGLDDGVGGGGSYAYTL